MCVISSGMGWGALFCDSAPDSRGQRGPKCHTTHPPCFLHAVPRSQPCTRWLLPMHKHCLTMHCTHYTNTRTHTRELVLEREGEMVVWSLWWQGAPQKCVTGFFEKPTHTTFGGLCAFTYNHPNTWNRSLWISRTTRPRPGTRARAEGQ